MKVMLTSDGGVVGNWVVVVEAGMVTLVVVVFVVVMVGVVVVVKGGEGLAGGRGEDIGTSTASSFLAASSDAVSSPGIAAESRCGYTSVAMSSRAGSVAVGATRAGKSEVVVGDWEGARKTVSGSAGKEV